MQRMAEMPETLSLMFASRLTLRKAQLDLTVTLSEAITNGRDVSEQMEEARKGGGISEGDYKQLSDFILAKRHENKLKEGM